MVRKAQSESKGGMASSEASFAVVDLSISLLSFVNIELRSQGWYAVRVRLLPDPRIKAVWPYRTALSEAAEQPSEDQIGKAEEGWSWHSRVFPIRYTLEEVPLGESPCFQVFLRNPTESLQTASLQVELELLHQEADIVSNPAPPVNFRLKPVARDVVRLSRVCEGVAAYYAASWGPAYLGLCHTTYYALLSGYVPARFLYSLRSTTGRDLRRPLSQRNPSGKIERSLSVASGSKAESLSKKIGWRGMMCGNIDTDQVLAPTANPLNRIDSIKEDAALARASSYTGLPEEQLLGAQNLVRVLLTTVQGGNKDSEGIMSEQQQARLRGVYEALVVVQREAVSSMSRILRNLPASCYHPQSYDVLRTLMAKEFQPCVSPEPSPSPSVHNNLGHSSPRYSGKCGFALNQKRMNRGLIGAAKGSSPPSRSPRKSIGADEQPYLTADLSRSNRGQKVEMGSAISQQQQRQQPSQGLDQQKEQRVPPSQGSDQQEEHRQGSPTRSDPGQGGSPPRPAHGPKYVGNAPTPLVLAPAQIAMTASPSFAEATPPPFSLSRLSRTLGLGDHAFSSGVAEVTSPMSPKSDTSSHHNPLSSLTSPTAHATPPLSKPTVPILLTPPDPIASPTSNTAHDQATLDNPVLDSAQEECSSSPQHTEQGSHENHDRTSADVHTLEPQTAAHPSTPPVPPLKLPLKGPEGTPALPPASSLEGLSSKVVAFADQAGAAVAVPTARAPHYQQGPPVASSMLLPPIHTSRNTRKLPSLKPSECAPSEERGKEGQANQEAGAAQPVAKQGATTTPFVDPSTQNQAMHEHQAFPMHQQQRQQSRKGSQRSSMAESTSESIALEVASWVEVPDPATFIAWLPPSCSSGAAVLYLDAVLARLRAAASSEWAVLQWVLRVSNVHATRHFKCLWETEQPGLVQPWVSRGTDSSSIQSAAALESRARAVRQSLQQKVNSHQLLPPQLHQPRIWDFPGQQPVLLVDDSRAPHITTWCMTGDTENEQPSTGPTDGPCKTSRNRPEPDSLHCYNRNNRGTHLCVFVHGYQGASTDLSLIKGQMGLLYPHVDMMCSKANEGRTQDSLQAMGERLAAEVCDRLDVLSLAGQKRPLAALSFVGHSLGTLITRAALASPRMAPYLPKLELFISICGPHLGQLYSKNGLVDMGVGFLKLMSIKGGSLHQLALSDAGSNTRTSWLYKLATSAPEGPGSLQLFRNVVLVASAQDRYVPLHSARLASCEAAQHDSNKQRREAFAEMLQASIQGFGAPQASQLLRVDVDFPPQGTNSSFFNNLLGRTAHIALIEDVDFARCLVWGVIRRYKLIRPDVVGTWLP